jgi:hypothetical protein
MTTSASPPAASVAPEHAKKVKQANRNARRASELLISTPLREPAIDQGVTACSISRCFVSFYFQINTLLIVPDRKSPAYRAKELSRGRIRPGSMKYVTVAIIFLPSR